MASKGRKLTVNDDRTTPRIETLDDLVTHLEEAYSEHGRALDDQSLILALGPGDPDGIRLAVANVLGDQTNARIARERIRARFVGN